MNDAPAKDAELRRIRYFQEIDDTLASGGQPTPEQFPVLRDAGYRVVVNLLPAEQGVALPGEGELVAALGMKYVHIPVVWTRPTAADLDQFFAAMDAARAADRKVFVHCAVNKRASTFVYLYRVLRAGVDGDEAEADLHDAWVPEGWWRDFVEERLREQAP